MELFWTDKEKNINRLLFIIFNMYLIDLFKNLKVYLI